MATNPKRTGDPPKPPGDLSKAPLNVLQAIRRCRLHFDILENSHSIAIAPNLLRLQELPQTFVWEPLQPPRPREGILPTFGHSPFAHGRAGAS